MRPLPRQAYVKAIILLVAMGEEPDSRFLSPADNGKQHRTPPMQRADYERPLQRTQQAHLWKTEDCCGESAARNLELQAVIVEGWEELGQA